MDNGRAVAGNGGAAEDVQRRTAGRSEIAANKNGVRHGSRRSDRMVPSSHSSVSRRVAESPKASEECT